MSAPPRAQTSPERWFSFAEREPCFHLLVPARTTRERARLACGYEPTRAALARRRELPTEKRPFNTPKCLRCLAVCRADTLVEVATRARGAAEPIERHELAAAIRIVAAERWALERLKPLLVAQGRSPHWPSTFTNGGCLIFAEALRRVIGGELIGILEFDDEDDTYDDVTAVSHVVVRLPTNRGPLFFDATGALGDVETLRVIYPNFGLSDNAQLIPFSPADGPANEIGFDERLTHDLAIALRAALRGQRSLRPA